MDCGWRGDCKVPKSILETRVWVIWRCRWGRWGYKVGQGDPLGEGVQTHGVKVAGGQGLGVVGAGVEGLSQLVQGAVEGGFEDAGRTHTRGQTKGVDDLLWTGVWWQLTPERGGQRCYDEILHWLLTIPVKFNPQYHFAILTLTKPLLCIFFFSFFYNGLFQCLSTSSLVFSVTILGLLRLLLRLNSVIAIAGDWGNRTASST